MYKRQLLGKGAFVMTVDQGPDMDRYQGVTPIEGETLALCAETYFAQSEQTPTRVRLAVGHVDEGAGRRWRAGGLLIQNIAEDDARGSTAEAWTTAQALFETVGEDELIDPQIASETLLWRLFHEDGVRLFDATPLTGFCRCSRERIVAVLGAFPPCLLYTSRLVWRRAGAAGGRGDPLARARAPGHAAGDPAVRPDR